ncbi:PREDICTED: ras-related protein Rab-10-like, partial [Acanthisitta chloris]|uniref:ras-related protein Rab-10-like n=1 Tax=Acanthisitta chloris TaxID=57068 RepID=UPI0004F0EB26
IDFKVKPVMYNDTRVKLQIWDTAGQERFHTLSTSYFRGAQGFVLVYDITDLKSFQSITIWMEDIYEKAGDEVDVILLGNKCDKESERVVPKQKGEKLAWEYGIPFFETSAKDNVNIEQAFSVLTKEILEKKSSVLYDLDVVTLNETKHKQSRRFLENIDDNFLSQVLKILTRNGVLLDLILTNKEGPVDDVKVGGSLVCSNHEIVVFSIKEVAGQQLKLQLQTSGKQTLTCLEIFLDESHGSRPCREEGSKRVGY